MNDGARHEARHAELWRSHWPAFTVLLLALVAALLLFWRRALYSGAPRRWLREWEGCVLRLLALSEVEQFAARFPARSRAFSDGERVGAASCHEPTRMLHPAADCFRGLGWRIQHTQLERDAQQRLWRCFEARGAGSACACANASRR